MHRQSGGRVGHSLGSKPASRKAAPSPAGGQVEVSRGQNPSLRIRSQAASAQLQESTLGPRPAGMAPGPPLPLRPQATKQTPLSSAGARSGNERQAAGWAPARDAGGKRGEGREREGWGGKEEMQVDSRWQAGSRQPST